MTGWWSLGILKELDCIGREPGHSLIFSIVSTLYLQGYTIPHTLST
jgi:hypothetical protein